MYNGIRLADTDYHRVGSLENLNSVLRLIVKYSSGRRMHQKDSLKLAGNTRIPEYELSMAFFTHCFHTLITTICNKKRRRLYFTLLLISEKALKPIYCIFQLKSFWTAKLETMRLVCFNFCASFYCIKVHLSEVGVLTLTRTHSTF